MSADETFSVEWFLARKYLAVEAKSSIIFVHSIIIRMLKLIDLPKSIKIKVGLFFGYQGNNYHGMQYQRPIINTITPPTIENTIHSAFCKGGFVLQTNMSNLRRIRWSRACRTDKRVHALCNGIAASLQFDERYITNWEHKTVDLNRVSADLNAVLPNDIRIFAMRRLGKAFDMRHQACSRIYHYICPLKLFQSKKDAASGNKVSDWQASRIVRSLQKMANLLVGSHSFHNFTKGYKQSDPKCVRYIKTLKVERVYSDTVETMIKEHGTQPDGNLRSEDFVRFTIVGQSFIYNQIRKMIGLLIQIYYEELQGEQTIHKAFAKQKFNLYLAPGEGLYLNRMTFNAYNSRKQEQHLKIILTLEQQKRIIHFKEKIESKILLAQLSQKVFSKWLAMHDQQTEGDSVQPQTDLEQD